MQKPHPRVPCLLLIGIWLMFFPAFGSGPAKVADRLVLAAAANTVYTVTSEVIVREAYRRLGIAVDIRKYPGERALKMADVGAGDVQRIDNLSAKYRNLIQLRPAINYIEATAFSRDRAIEIAGWESLRPHQLGIIRGIKFAENNTGDMKRYVANDYAGLFRMVKGNRVDLAISLSLNGHYQSAVLGIDGVFELKPAIMRFDLFHYIHKSRAHLKPRLETVFRDMAAAGQLTKTRAHVIDVLLRQASQNIAICDKDYKCLEEGLSFLGRN